MLIINVLPDFTLLLTCVRTHYIYSIFVQCKVESNNNIKKRQKHLHTPAGFSIGKYFKEELFVSAEIQILDPDFFCFFIFIFNYKNLIIEIMNTTSPKSQYLFALLFLFLSISSKRINFRIIHQLINWEYRFYKDQ